MTDQTEFQRGWDAAMAQAEQRIRDAERSRMCAIEIAGHAHAMAKTAAAILAPMAELYRWECEHRFDPVQGPPELRDVRWLSRFTDSGPLPGVTIDNRFGDGTDEPEEDPKS